MTAAYPAAKTVTVTDLLSKKSVVVKVTDQTQLRKLQPQMAQMIAMRLKGAAANGNGAPGGKGKSETLFVMRFHPRIAPIKAGVFPLLKNKPELIRKARAVRDLLRPWMTVFYDEGGSIGKRYARQDEAGTPFCVTIDFETLGEKPELLDTVTLRYRDDGRQERVKISELRDVLLSKVRG